MTSFHLFTAQVFGHWYFTGTMYTKIERSLGKSFTIYMAFRACLYESGDLDLLPFDLKSMLSVPLPYSVSISTKFKHFYGLPFLSYMTKRSNGAVDNATLPPPPRVRDCAINIWDYRDLSGLCKASVGLDVSDVYRCVVAACEATAGNANAKRVRAVLYRRHSQTIKRYTSSSSAVNRDFYWLESK